MFTLAHTLIGHPGLWHHMYQEVGVPDFIKSTLSRAVALGFTLVPCDHKMAVATVILTKRH